MPDLKKIKSKKLKELMGKSLKFSALPEEEQVTRIEEISKLPVEQQEELFCPFFEKENKIEAEKMKEIDANKQKAIMELMLQIDEMDKRLSKLEKEDLEVFDREGEEKKQEKLLKELENL
jgi:HSP90 family molecular chaperone